MSDKNLFPLHPDRERLLIEAMTGPQNGEDHNAFHRRMNARLTENDRQWIVDFMARHIAHVKDGTATPVKGWEY